MLHLILMEVIKMSLLESGENYLETILVLTKRNGSVRSIDIAEEMNFTKASVSRAMSILKRDNYIIMEPDGRILLTKDGQKKAAAVYDRHPFHQRDFGRGRGNCGKGCLPHRTYHQPRNLCRHQRHAERLIFYRLSRGPL